MGQVPSSDGERMGSGRAGTVPIQRARPDGSVKKPWVEEGVKKCWDSQPAAEAAIDSTRLLGRRL